MAVLCSFCARHCYPQTLQHLYCILHLFPTIYRYFCTKYYLGNRRAQLIPATPPPADRRKHPETNFVQSKATCAPTTCTAQVHNRAGYRSEPFPSLSPIIGWSCKKETFGTTGFLLKATFDAGIASGLFLTCTCARAFDFPPCTTAATVPYRSRIVGI